MLTRAYEVYQITGQLLSAQALDMIEPWQAELVLPEGQQAFLTQSQRAGRRQRVDLLAQGGRGRGGPGAPPPDRGRRVVLGCLSARACRLLCPGDHPLGLAGGVGRPHRRAGAPAQ